MDDPEAPGIHHREVCGAPEEGAPARRRAGWRRPQAGTARELAGARGSRRAGATRPDEQNGPEHQPDGQQDLPDAADLEILPALVADQNQSLSRQLYDAQRIRRARLPATTKKSAPNSTLTPALVGVALRAQGPKRGRARRPHRRWRSSRIASLQVPGAQEVAGQDSRGRCRRNRRGRHVVGHAPPTSAWASRRAGHDGEELQGRPLPAVGPASGSSRGGTGPAFPPPEIVERPKASSTTAVPPSSAIRLRALQRTLRRWGRCR